MTNPFRHLVETEAAAELRLGNPLSPQFKRHGPIFLTEASERRLNHFATLNPNGFRQPKKPLRTRADGTTRGERKRKAYAEAMAKVSEDRPAKYMHAAARRRHAAGLLDAAE